MEAKSIIASVSIFYVDFQAMYLPAMPISSLLTYLLSVNIKIHIFWKKAKNTASGALTFFDAPSKLGLCNDCRDFSEMHKIII